MRHRIFAIVSITAWAELFRERIERVPEFEVVGIAPDAATALVALQSMTQSPRIVMIDVGTLHALENAAAFRRYDGMHLVAIGLDEEPSQVIAWAVAGADGLVERTASLTEVLNTLTRVASGEAHCSDAMSRMLLLGMNNRLGVNNRDGVSCEGGWTALLTRREEEVAWLVTRGLTNKEIAVQLQIEPGTVKSHVHSVIHKLGVVRRAHVASRLQAPQLPPEGDKVEPALLSGSSEMVVRNGVSFEASPARQS